MTLGPAVFFTPHQDDETLSMGASIVQHVRAGRVVYVVLLTDGGSTSVGITYVHRWPTREELVAERDREFTAAVTRMGAIPVIRQDRMIDGTLSIDYAQRVISEYIADYPDGSFKTMSETDASPDHANLGKALRRTKVVDARYYIKRIEMLTNARGVYTAYERLPEVFLDYAPVGWLSVPPEFTAGFTTTRNKIYA